jgi:proline iminopeptidase
MWLAAATACADRAQVREGGTVPDSGFITVDNTALPYRIEGRGRPCIVFGSHLYYPRLFSASFAERLRCAHVDQRGFIGAAPTPPNHGYTVDVAVADIEAARVALGFERIVLVGHSMHGTVALAYALAHPSRVLGVVAIGAPPDFDSTLTVAAANYWTTFASAGRRAYDRTNPLRLAPDSLRKLSAGQAFIATYVGNSARYWADSSFDASSLWQGMEANPSLIFQLFDLTAPYRLPTAAAPAGPPVFLALGRFDFVVPPSVWEGRGVPFPQFSKVIFERSGHTPQFEEQAGFDAALSKWLDRLP